MTGWYVRHPAIRWYGIQPLAHVARLGLMVNTEKSCLVPSQRVAYLGLVLDSVAMKACLSPRRMSDILQLLPHFRRGRWLPYIKFCSSWAN